MGTVTAARPAEKTDREFVSIVIEIKGVRYAVDPIDPGQDGAQAFRLTKQGGDRATYDVIRRNQYVITCNCPDYLYRQAGKAMLCKHVDALIKEGLFPPPAWY
jgi:hypothetical protein